MSSISNATSTRAEADPPRRSSPWRAIVIVILLLAAGIYAAVVLPPRLRQFRADQRDGDVALAGMAAESVELQWDSVVTDDPTVLFGDTAKLFEVDDSIAYVRIFDSERKAVCEITRSAPHRANISTNPALRAQGVGAEMDAMAQRLADPDWVKPVSDLQTLILSQGVLASQLDDALAGGAIDDLVRNSLYSQQLSTVTMAETLEESFPAISGAVACMKDAQAALEHGDTSSLERASQCATDAESALSSALEKYRAVIGKQPVTLTPALAAVAPPPASVLARLWRSVNGRRVLIPLFLAGEGEDLATPLGWCEVVFYDRPADRASLALLPAAALLLALVLLIFRPRKKRRRRQQREW